MDADLDGRICEFARPRRFSRTPASGDAIRPTPDATIVLGLADLALELARDPRDEVDRWLTLLCCYGDAAEALRGGGIPQGPLRIDHLGAGGEAGNPDTDDVVRSVTGAALRLARARGMARLTTTHILFAVAEVYGPLFYHALVSAVRERRSRCGARALRAVRAPGTAPAPTRSTWKDAGGCSLGNRHRRVRISGTWTSVARRRRPPAAGARSRSPVRTGNRASAARGPARRSPRPRRLR